MNHCAFGEIQDGGYFYRKCPYPFKKLLKPVFRLVFGSHCYLLKKIGINIHFNALLAWPDIKFLCHWPEKGPDFVRI